jgi:hypothetical protein
MLVLNNNEYEEILNNLLNKGVNNKPISSIVKSYFWAARTINNCQCLPRSIALYQHLKSLGYDVEHKFGVNNSDKTLKAHAWVEYQNKPLNEHKDVLKRFQVLKPNNNS